MHIAFFNRAYYPEISATGQLLTELAESLVRDHGCRVTVITGTPHGPRAQQTTDKTHNGVTILRAWGTTWQKDRFWRRAVNYLTYFASACWAALRIDRADVVIALTDPPIIGLAGEIACRRFRAPLVLSYRDLFPEVARTLEKPPGKWADVLLNAVNRFLNRRAARVVALGEAMRDRLTLEKGVPPEKVRIIPDWADTVSIRPQPKQNDFSRKHGLEGKFVVMYSGNLGNSQNLEPLLAAAEILQTQKEFSFVLIGEGVRKAALYEWVKRRALGNVLFLPFQPKESLSEVFAAADCFFLSLKPGLAGYSTPSKLYGILAAGRPYVAAIEEFCEVARITQKHRCGLLAAPTDAADIAAKLLQLRNDPALARTLGANARSCSERFSKTEGVSKYFQLCRELVVQSHGKTS